MLTPDDRDLIVAMRKSGTCLAEIAEIVGCSERSVSAVLVANGMLKWKRRITCDRDHLLDMWQRGLTLIQIGIELGCSSATVVELAKEMNMPRRPGQRVDPDGDVSPEEDAASADSLALSPYVQARIKELGLGMPA